MIVAWIEEQAHCEKIIGNIKIPMLFAQAEFETLVSNDYITKFYKLNSAQNDKSRLIDLKNVDHTTVVFEESSLNHFGGETISLFNTAIAVDNI
jgi:hypothetical protein